jgi:hypothetical protein
MGDQSLIPMSSFASGLEVVGTPRVVDKTIVVELRLNTNLHDLTIEQVCLGLSYVLLGVDLFV